MIFILWFYLEYSTLIAYHINTLNLNHYEAYIANPLYVIKKVSVQQSKEPNECC